MTGISCCPKDRGSAWSRTSSFSSPMHTGRSRAPSGPVHCIDRKARGGIMLKLSTVGRAVVAIGVFAVAPLAAQQPIVLQWQTANLTESQYEPVWKQTIAEFEAANPGIKVEPVLVARKDHWTK